MSLKEKIILSLRESDGQTDRELTDSILGLKQTQQPINKTCRALVDKGIITRVGSPIKNYLSDQQISFPVIKPLVTVTKADDNNHLHEENIKVILNEYLVTNGWSTQVAWGKSHGTDISATKDGIKWIIEVKGCGSLNPMRVNYFLSILGEILQRMDDPNARYSIALPNIQQFRNLWSRLPDLAKERTHIDAIFVDSDGVVLWDK